MPAFDALLEAAANGVVLANDDTPFKMFPAKEPPRVKEVRKHNDKKEKRQMTKGKKLDFRRKSPRFIV